MTDFFAQRAPDQPGLALFLNAGDPPLDTFTDVLWALDDCGVDCLELAVPFPDSPTDGPVIRRSAARALAAGADLHQVLDLVASARPTLRRLRIAVFADWSYSAKHRPLEQVIRQVADSGADGFLLHGLPPRLQPEYHRSAADARLPLVTTCYRTSRPAVMADAATNATAYLYLVAHYGRSGTTTAPDEAELAIAIAAVKALSPVPVAVGFGVRSASDVAAMHGLGADAVIVGTAAVAAVERAQAEGDDVPGALADFARSLRPEPERVVADTSSTGGRDA